MFAIDIIIGNYSAANVYCEGQAIGVPCTRLVMSTTLIDPTQQEGMPATGLPAGPVPPAMAELPDPSTYKVYRPPTVLDSTSSKR